MRASGLLLIEAARERRHSGHSEEAEDESDPIMRGGQVNLVWDTEGKEIAKAARQKEEDEETRNFPTPELPRTIMALEILQE
ncbi:hypothetical protein MMC26_003282 [Xylographa opegraphella]|nr:hypothetical protein [Xylographa opegraphella]